MFFRRNTRPDRCVGRPLRKFPRRIIPGPAGAPRRRAWRFTGSRAPPMIWPTRVRRPRRSGLRRSTRVQAALEAIAAGDPPPQPPFAELAVAIARHRLPLAPFHDLLSAFRQDVTTSRYASATELLDYCRRSADPIGRLLLHLYDARRPSISNASDAICTALQLANFWQDIALDWAKGRVYLPQEDLARFGVAEAQIGEARCDARVARADGVRNRAHAGNARRGSAARARAAVAPRARALGRPRRRLSDPRSDRRHGWRRVPAAADTHARGLGVGRVPGAVPAASGRAPIDDARTNIANRKPCRAARASTTASCSCRRSGAARSPRSTPFVAKSTTSSTSRSIRPSRARSSPGGARRSARRSRARRSIRSRAR